MPRPKRNGSWVRAQAESLNYLKASSSEDAFFVCAPTKTQRVLGSNPAESQLSVLIREQGVETWLEASTERSESNPGRSLGIYTAYSDSCLEDSTSPRPSIRCQSDKSVFEKNSVVNEHGLNGLNGWNKISINKTLFCICPDQNAMGPGFEPQPNHS